MREKFTVSISKDLAGQRLDLAVFKSLAPDNPDLTREKVRESIVEGGLKLDDKPFLKAGYKVKGGERGEIEISKSITNLSPDESVRFEVVYEDGDIIVVNKPPGLVVHPGAGVRDSTLVHGILSKFKIEDSDQHERPGIVHRLDRGTSGLMVVAKTEKAKLNLQGQFKPPRTIHRIYECVVRGSLQVRRGVEFERGEGRISAPLVRSERKRTIFEVNFKGEKEAVTNFKILKSKGLYQLIECELETGRTHQIRAHLKYLNLPIVGDVAYGGERRGDWPLLHAKKLTFLHPETKEKISFEASNPETFSRVVKELSLNIISSLSSFRERD